MDDRFLIPRRLCTAVEFLGEGICFGSVLYFILSREGFIAPLLSDSSGGVMQLFTTLALVVAPGVAIALLGAGMNTLGYYILQRRARTHRCLGCGYSLLGLRRTTTRCPECGSHFR